MAHKVTNFYISPDDIIKKLNLPKGYEVVGFSASPCSQPQYNGNCQKCREERGARKFKKLIKTSLAYLVTPIVLPVGLPLYRKDNEKRIENGEEPYKNLHEWIKSKY
jgi:hypothetical protein